MSSSSLEEPGMGHIHPEADRAVAQTGIDLINGARNLFPSCQLGGAKRKKQVTASLMEQAHMAQMNADADNRARSCLAPEANP